MRDVVILGSTGSIGVQALEVIASNPSLFRVVGVSSAGSNPELVIAQAKQFKVSHVGVVSNADVVRTALPYLKVLQIVRVQSTLTSLWLWRVITFNVGGLLLTIVLVQPGRLLIYGPNSLVLALSLFSAVVSWGLFLSCVLSLMFSAIVSSR